MGKLFKAAAWVSMLGLVVLTVIPADERPVTGLQHDWEHFIAFGPAGFLLGLLMRGAFAGCIRAPSLSRWLWN
jgi:hypothetical protein